VTIPTFTAGSVLTASQMNQVAKQVVVTCTSGTRPSSPPEGMTIYETDTEKLLTYTTSTTGWVPPWNLPWGYVATASTTSTTTGVGSSYTDASTLSVTWTTVQNRRYRVTGYLDFGSSSATISYVAITDGSNAIKAVAHESHAANDIVTFSPAELFTAASSTSTTRKLRVKCDAGTGGTQSNVYGPHFILVEDIGPNGAPA